jgi:hypothetical protein
MRPQFAPQAAKLNLDVTAAGSDPVLVDVVGDRRYSSGMRG